MNNRHFLTICGVTCAILAGLGVSSAWAQASPEKTTTKATRLIVGQWKLNAEKSHVQLPPDSLELRQYNLRPDGFLVGLLVTVTAQGYHYLQFTAKSDGKDYPEYSDQITSDMIAEGKATPRTYSETIVDDYVTQWTDKRDGKVTQQGKKIVSKDGKTLTITTDGRPDSQARIYDRQ